jgi:ABC-type polysaccharide/polyol phosphate export systems, permease component
MKTWQKTILETKTMTKRNLWKSLRNPDRIIENFIAPVMTMIIFIFVLGGAMGGVTDMNYTNYIVPGVLILCIGQCSTATAVGISSDVQQGIIDRFRSMPIASQAVLNGHVIESVIRTTISIIIVFLISLLVGFRPEFSLYAWFLAFIVLLLFTLMITWMAVAYGLFVKSSEGASSLAMFIMMFIYLSSGFIPTQTLPKALRIFAENQPVTSIIESVRRLLLSQQLENYLYIAIIWCVGILIVAYALAMHLYKTKVNK